MNFKGVSDKYKINSFDYLILGVDIGATNTRSGIFGINDGKLKLLCYSKARSGKLISLISLINWAVDYAEKNFKFSLKKACIGIAGIVSKERNYAEMTNLNLKLNKRFLLKNTKLKEILLVNDFEAIGYGINILPSDSLIPIKKSDKIAKAPAVVIGAGTGLGKTALLYNSELRCYIPMPSEAGHSDFAAQTKEEIELINFIKRREKVQNVSYEDVLSGKGLSRIYAFLNSKGLKSAAYAKEINKAKSKPELISKYRKIDATCKKTFELFAQAYAKFARNCAIDAMPYGGIYIAGGIAPKNIGIFNKNFVKTFEDNKKMKDVLRKIPIYMISNENAGLLGAAFAGVKLK